ncbi:hypothetical protein ElyMa_003921900 [Elysia marginata]|uniref:Uncharacterized protein n=1 Tax=Elysia marginata TaxID=1093978 RepID=A0AAV4FT30_9GAST|nr:hypothetical protein ElyMa_003921900 [Elysia marginata]
MCSLKGDRSETDSPPTDSTFRRGQSSMLMGARPNSRRQTHLNHQDPHPAFHGSHLTANKVPNSRERNRFRGIEESDRTTVVRPEDGKKTKQEG